MEYNILITCAGRRNYLINYFKKDLKGRGKVIASDTKKLATALVEADISVCVPDCYNENYIESLVEIVKKHSVKAIISLNDLELPVISRNKSVFEEFGTKVVVSSEDVISIASDKWKTHNFLINLGLNSPKTYIGLDEALRDIDKGVLSFPIVLKPRFGSASNGIEYVNTVEELKLNYELKIIKLKKSFSEENINNLESNNYIIIQEKIDGKEFGIDMVNDFEGNYFGTFVREKISMRSGETDKAITVIDNSFSILGKKISESLKHIGIMDTDVIVYDGKMYVLDLNVRFGGGYPFSHNAGANIAGVYVDWIIGDNESNPLRHINYKSGIIQSKCDRIIKHKV